MIESKIITLLRIEGKFLNMIKNIYEEPTANITCNGERLKTCFLKSRKKQGYLLLPLSLNIVLEVLAIAIKC